MKLEASRMHERKKTMIARIAAVLMIGIAIFWFLGSDIEHIEDTNGPDNYSLTTITDENIIKRDVGALGLNKKKGLLTGDAIEFTSKKFTGVEEIFYTNYLGKSDFYIDLYNFEVHEGNFKMAIVLNDEIVAELEPDMIVSYELRDIEGTIALRIAGESASFKFGINEFDLDRFEHN